MAKYLDYLALQELVAKVKELFEPFEAVDTQDNTTAYTKQVPSSAKGLVTFNKIGGMSYKCKNLCNIRGASGNNIVLANAPIGTYTLCLYNSGDGNTSGRYDLSYGGGGVSSKTLDTPVTFTTTSVSDISVYCNANMGTPYVMLNTGSTALPYEAYYEGLHHSEVTKVESVGTNVWDEEWEVGGYDTNGEAITYATTIRSKATNYIQVLPNTTYYANSAGKTIYIATYDSDKNFISYLPSVNGITNNTFTTPSNAKYIRFQMGSAYGQTYNHDICINVSNSSINGQYFAYDKHELAIPSGARVKYGVNENCHDYIDFDTKTKHNICGIVDLGSLTWVYMSGYPCFQVILATAKIPTSTSTPANLVCSIYTSIASSSVGNVNMSMAISSDGYLRITNTSYTDATAFKTAMSGVYLVYELSTPTVTDVSDILTEQHLPIQPYGTLTMVNTDKNAVPSVVTYDNGLVEVVKSNHLHDIEQQKEIDKLKSDKQDKLTAGSGITISGNIISADGVVKYRNILRLIDTSTGNPVFEFAKVGNTALYDEQAFENLTATNVLNYLDNIGDTYNGCAYIVVGGEERDFVQVDKTGATDLFEVVYQGLIGIKHDSSNLELTVCFLDSNNDAVISTSSIGDDNSASYCFVGKSEEV